MSRNKQIVILFFLLTALSVHFVFIAIYTFPFQPANKNKISYYAQWYAYPFFNQNWNLFVPAPNTNYKCFVSYENNGVQQLDLLEEILNKHQSNRYLGYSSIVLAFVNSMHYFEKNSPLQEKLNGPIKDDLNFTILETSAKNYIEVTRGIEVKNFKLILFVETLVSKQQKVYFNMGT